MHVLVALDLEDTALETLQQASRMLGSTGAVFDLLYVDPTHTEADFLGEPELRDQLLGNWDRHRVRWHNKLEMLLFRVQHANRGRARVEVGDPVQAIVRVAGEYDAVVVGAKQRPLLSRLLSASVADRVMRAAPVPVLVMRSGEVSAPEMLERAAPDPQDEPQPTDNVLPFRTTRSRSAT